MQQNAMTKSRKSPHRNSNWAEVLHWLLVADRILQTELVTSFADQNQGAFYISHALLQRKFISI